MSDSWGPVNDREAILRTKNYIYTAVGNSFYDDWGYDYFDIYRKDLKTGNEEIIIECLSASQVYMIEGRKGIYLIQNDRAFGNGARISIWLLEQDDSLRLLYFDRMPASKYTDDQFNGICSVATNRNIIYIIGSSMIYSFNTNNCKMELIDKSNLAYTLSDEFGLQSYASKAEYLNGVIRLFPDDIGDIVIIPLNE